MADQDALIKKSILKALKDCGSYPCPEGALRSQVEFTASRMTRVEFDSALKDLDAAGFVAGVAPKIGTDRKWVITDAGKLALADL